MNINNLNNNQQQLMRNAFKNGSQYVELAEEKFLISEPNYCGGSIRSNCKVLNGEDIDIITSFDIDRLEKIQQDMIYLNKLIEVRKNQIGEKEYRHILYVKEYREDNKKMIKIYVDKNTYIKDSYGDKKYIDNVTIDEYNIKNIKSNQKKIEEKINELKEKYNAELN